MRYWINTISKSHVDRGVAGGFTQADHGKATRLKRLAKGDSMIFYSPRTDFPDGDALQRFTAIGSVTDDEPHQIEVSPEFRPWRRKLQFRACSETPIQPLIDSLDFIRNKKNWGIMFRRGLFEIGEEDFMKIARAMNAGDAEIEG